MASSPITSWQIDGEKWETSQILFSWAPKSLKMVTAAMKLRHLPLGRKVITNLDSILKSRDITLPTKVCLVKAMVFPVVMYGCDSWTIQKTECQRIDAFELWCWRRLLRVPWKPVLIIYWKDWCWIWNSNALATWCKELINWKRPWCWEGLKEGTEWGDGRWDGWLASLTWWTWVWANSRSWW